MSIEVAALRIGGSVAQLAAGRWLAGRGEREAAGRDLVELIKTGFPDEIRRRRVHHQFEGIAFAVTERLMTFAGHEFRGLTDGDRAAALDQVVRTLDTADLSDEAFLAADADPVRLARSLRSRLPARKAEFELGEAGARLYDVVLDECCDCLARILIHLPQFGPRASAETLNRLTGLADQIGVILSRLPARTLTAPEGDADDAEFTRRYLACISETLDTLELFGVRFERLTRPQTSLSVAYISLNVSREDHRDRKPAEAIPISDWRDETPARTVRVESALGAHRLTLVRGEAGGGKSTLLRWLAVTAARGAFTGPLAEWNGLVPFVVKLRSHAGGPLPRPEEFLDGTAGHLAGIMPRGWAHRRLLEGRALLLVDGVDEIAGAQRHAVRQWLRGLVREFRDIRVIVTSRPAAAGSDWLRAEGFAPTFLEQLAPADVRALVQHWHTAVRDCADLPCPPERVPSYEARLLARLESAPHLRALASSPLLAAMLCALNLDRETLPRNRMGLYSAALDMLLETRDAKRGIPSALEREQKVRLLQEIAWHLSTSARVELPKPMVERLIADRLAAMPQARVPAPDVLDLLLQRSGVLRQPVPGRIDFVHRTVQEYLAAKHAADIGDMDLLVRHAHRDTWRETVIMAAGHANEPSRRELITGILARAAAEPRHARALKVVAVACLETLPSVPDDLRAGLDRCLDDLVPPRSSASARTLAAAGEPALARFPETLDGLSEKVAAATIRAAWMINGPEALDVLARYAPQATGTAQMELSAAWDYFDAHEYANRVLTGIPPGGKLFLSSDAQAAFLPVVPPLAELSLPQLSTNDFDFLLPHASTLEYLFLRSLRGLEFGMLPHLPALKAFRSNSAGQGDLRFLDDLPRLRDLYILNCDDVTDFAPIRRQDTLVSLGLTSCYHLTSLSSLPDIRDLRALGLGGSRIDNGLSEICERAPCLTWLEVSLCDWVADLSPLSRLPLQHLQMYGCDRIKEFGPLTAMTDLVFLDLTGTRITDLAPLEGMVKLRTLHLNNCEALTDLRPLAALPSLETVYLRNARPGLDLSPLAASRRLKVVISPGQDVRGGEALGRRLRT